MNIDLNTCKPGQSLRLRNGALATYVGTNAIDKEYPHIVQFSTGSLGRRKDDGSAVTGHHNVVEIVVEEPAEGYVTIPRDLALYLRDLLGGSTPTSAREAYSRSEKRSKFPSRKEFGDSIVDKLLELEKHLDL